MKEELVARMSLSTWGMGMMWEWFGYSLFHKALKYVFPNTASTTWCPWSASDFHCFLFHFWPKQFYQFHVPYSIALSSFSLALTIALSANSLSDYLFHYLACNPGLVDVSKQTFSIFTLSNESKNLREVWHQKGKIPAHKALMTSSH